MTHPKKQKVVNSGVFVVVGGELPKLMAVLSWKKKKMLPRLCPFLEVI